jgi:hypothetical protein
MLEQHLLIEVAGDVRLIRHINLFGASATCLVNLVSI